MHTGTNIDLIKFKKEDINENMFTKKQLWDCVERLVKENEKYRQSFVFKIGEIAGTEDTKERYKLGCELVKLIEEDSQE